jgi:Eukaryotic aspartyl protease
LKSSSFATEIPFDIYCGPHGGACINLAEGNKSNSVTTGKGSKNVGEEEQTRCLFSDSFVDDSYAIGYLVSGPVTWANRTVNSTTYGVITSATPDFFEAPQGGGILGMAFATDATDCNAFSCFPPLYDDMVHHNDVSDIFAICGSREEPLMTIGGGDARLYEGKLEYVDLQQPYADYLVDIAGLDVGDQHIAEEKDVQVIREIEWKEAKG